MAEEEQQQQQRQQQQGEEVEEQVPPEDADAFTLLGRTVIDCPFLTFILAGSWAPHSDPGGMVEEA